MPVYQSAYFVVRDDAREVCENAIREFVEYVRGNEPDTFTEYELVTTTA
jgi:hypothetical protein